MTTPVASSITSITTIAASCRCIPTFRHRATAQILCAFVLMSFAANAIHADQSASLAWNPVTATPVAGYAFYVGNSNGVYASRFDVGTNTQITISGLKEGRTNYFTVTSYDSARIESPATPAVAYIVPGLVQVSTAPRPGVPCIISYPQAIGHSYVIQASTNLVAWTNLWQTAAATSNTWTTYQDWQASAYRKRFYRLIMQ